MRVMKYKVIWFKSVYDTCACRIIVPEEHQYKALNPEIWPTAIKVRKWKNYHEWTRERQMASHWGKTGDYSRYDDQAY